MKNTWQIVFNKCVCGGGGMSLCPVEDVKAKSRRKRRSLSCYKNQTQDLLHAKKKRCATHEFIPSPILGYIKIRTFRLIKFKRKLKMF